MKSRLARFLSSSALGLTVVAGPAWSQEKTGAPQSETPRVETAPAPALVPATAMPVSEAFVPVLAPRHSIAVGVEFLQWWYKRDAIPSLLNTAPETNTVFAGTLDDPNAFSLFGPNEYDYKTVPGVRFIAAFAIVENVDFELGAFVMESKSINATFAGTNGTPFLTRPFFNAHDLVEGGFDTSTLSGVSGSLNVQSHNRFYGTEANISWVPIFSDCSFNKLLLGFRQISLREDLFVTENLTSNQGTLAPDDRTSLLAFFPTRVPGGADPNGTLINTNFDAATQSIRIVDGFVTRNEFYGPQAGAQWHWARGAFSFDLLTKVAVGVNHETIRVQGATSLLTGGVVTQTGPGGLLAISPNSGVRTFDELTVVPELGLKFNFDVCDNVRVNFGYNLLYMSSVVRPGTQIDRRINPQFVPSDIAFFPQGARPDFPHPFFRDTDFCAHGLTFGLVISY
jgi:hypothetical protein